MSGQTMEEMAVLAGVKEREVVERLEDSNAAGSLDEAGKPMMDQVRIELKQVKDAADKVTGMIDKYSPAMVAANVSHILRAVSMVVWSFGAGHKKLGKAQAAIEKANDQLLRATNQGKKIE